MSDLEETKPDANKLLTCKLEFEAHNEDTPDLPSCVDEPCAAESSIEQTTDVKPSLILDSSDDEEFSNELLCSASGDSESLPEDRQKSSVGETSGINPNMLLDSSDDEEFDEELLCSAPGESSQPPVAKTAPKDRVKKVKLLSCYICKKEFEHNRDLLIHWQTHKSSSKSCNICGKSFVNMVLLNKHSMVHFNKEVKNSFICKHCDCTFLQKQDFISHMLFFKHDENRIIKCEKCGGFFVNESDLKAHLVTHLVTDEKKNKALHCEECGENFQKRLDLRNHMVNHIGERNYKCAECNLTFKSKFVLTKHQDVIHSNNLVCSICNLSFSKKDKKNYNFHLKLHSK